MVSHFRRKASARQSLSFPQTANSKTKCARPQNVSLSQSQLAVIISRFAIFTLLTISVYFPSSLAIICAPLGAFSGVSYSVIQLLCGALPTEGRIRAVHLICQLSSFILLTVSSFYVYVCLGPLPSVYIL